MRSVIVDLREIKVKSWLGLKTRREKRWAVLVDGIVDDYFTSPDLAEKAANELRREFAEYDEITSILKNIGVEIVDGYIEEFIVGKDYIEIDLSGRIKVRRAVS